MRKKLLQSFIDNHPNHFLNSYLQILIENDLTDFNTIRDLINEAYKAERLDKLEINQTDILLNSLSLVKE